MISGYHSGDMGDIIYGIPAFRQMGITHLHLNPAPPVKMDLRCIMFLTSLLRAEGFEVEIHYTPELSNYYLDTFRNEPDRSWGDDHLGNIVAKPHGIQPDLTKSWLSLEDALPSVYPIIINHSGRYRGKYFNWFKIADFLEETGIKAAYVGTMHEYYHFSETYPINIPFMPTSNAQHLKNIIGGAKCFIGNQSMPFALAEGLKINRIQETCLWTANSLPQSKNGIAVVNRDSANDALDFLYNSVMAPNAPKQPLQGSETSKGCPTDTNGFQ